MKRNIFILLIAICVGVTWFSVNYKERLSSETKIAVENAILALPEFPARPVWWQEDSVLAIGVVPGKVNPHHSAAAACKVLRANGINTTLVEIYDVVKIQKEDEWEKLAADNCRSY